MNAFMCVYVDEYIYMLMHVCADSDTYMCWKNGWMHGCMNVCVDTYMCVDAWMNGCMYILILQTNNP